MWKRVQPSSVTDTVRRSNSLIPGESPGGSTTSRENRKRQKEPLPKPGFGSPIAVRGMHPSGFFEVLVSSVKELIGIDPKTHAIRIGATVGERRRIGLQEKALAEGFKVLNARTVKTGSEQEKIQKPLKVADTKKTEEKKPATSKAPAEPVKKETKKTKKMPEAEEKKTVKEKKPVKPKAEPAEKTPEKTKAASPVKSAKTNAKPKMESSSEAEPKAAAKPKAKKKTESEVKKNE